MSDQRLAGKVALITGAAGGMGLAAAKRFVKEGAYVFVADLQRDRLEVAVSEIGQSVQGIPTDITKLGDLDSLYAEIAREKGRLDIVYANAGIGTFASLEEVTEEYFDRIFAVNAKGTLFTVQKALPLLVDGGVVLLTGSIADSKGFPRFGVYNATKAVIRSYARTWAAELAPRKIRVNVIGPGTIDTPFLGGGTAEDRKAFLDMIPLGRLGLGEDIASAAVFLASDEASFIDGAALYVDGAAGQL